MFKLQLALSVLGAMMALGAFVYVFCRPLLPVAKFIDAVNGRLGVVANWLVLLACLVSAGNAIFRYVLTPITAVLRNPDYAWLHGTLRVFSPVIDAYGRNANGFLESQWYMFAGMVLLGAAYTLKVNEHVRVDLFYGMVSDRTRHIIDLLGGVVFLLPICLLLIYFTWPWFVDSWRYNEASQNAGGLIRWPVKLLLPVGFALVAVQGFSEIVKRAAAVRGFYHHEHAYEKPLQ